MSTQKYRVRSGEDLGRVLRDARAIHGFTQQQLVDQLELGFDRTRLARIEAGEGFQSLDRALSVLRRLGIEVHATVPEPAHPRDREKADFHDRAHAEDERPPDGATS
jgi:transcriptional regulator with XRE-family HTH domain